MSKWLLRIWWGIVAFSVLTIAMVSCISDGEDPAKEPATPTFNFAANQVTEDNVRKAMAEAVPKEKLSKIEVEDKGGWYIVSVFYNPGDMWNEKALVNDTASTAVDVMEILLKHEAVGKVWFWTQGSITDPKGNTTLENVINVSLTKENAKDINWPNFKTMVKGDYKKLFAVADSTYLHPGISKELIK